MVYRNGTSIGAYLDLDLDIIWLKECSSLSMIHNLHAEWRVRILVHDWLRKRQLLEVYPKTLESTLFPLLSIVGNAIQKQLIHFIKIYCYLASFIS